MFICICNAITERQLQSAVADGAGTLSDLQGQLGIGTCCGCCIETANHYLPGGRYAGQVTTEKESGTHAGIAANDAQAGSDNTMVTVAVRRA
ncbi:MAG TPA: (2Fe-2S)-binding protein [Paralcaligenes sp.]